MDVATPSQQAREDARFAEAFNTFVRVADYVYKAFIHNAFVRFVRHRWESNQALGTYDIVVPSDGLRSYRATVNLTDARTWPQLLQREVVWDNGQRCTLQAVVGSYSTLRYWSNLAEVYRYDMCSALTALCTVADALTPADISP